MASFNGVLPILSVLCAVLRLCSVESPHTAKASNTTIQSVVSSYKLAKPTSSDYGDTSKVPPVPSMESSSSSLSQESSFSSLSSSNTADTSSSSSSTSSSTSSSSTSSSSSSSTEVASLSEFSISTSEFEFLVKPTVAPATPHEDLESISPSLSVSEPTASSTVFSQQVETDEQPLVGKLEKENLEREENQEKEEIPEKEENREKFENQEKVEKQDKVNHPEKNEQNVESRDRVVQEPVTIEVDQQEVKVDEVVIQEERSTKEPVDVAEPFDATKRSEAQSSDVPSDVIPKDVTKKAKPDETEHPKDQDSTAQKYKTQKGNVTEEKVEQEMKDKEEDSITAGLKQAEEETKPASEEMPSFDEFKRQLLQEEEQKSKLKQQQDEQENKDITAKTKARKVKQRKQNNYASMDCGAKVVKVNPEASNPFTILQENRDIYMLNPCTAKIWFIVELCDTVQVKTIEIANFELFSSTPESFRVFVSGRYPTREWTMLGTFQGRDERNVQSFPLDEPIYAKYLKVEMLSHFGSEHYCPLSLLRVFGTSMVEELEDHEAGSQDDTDTVDHDDDTLQILPPEPSTKHENQPSKPNILATVGDTLFNMVKEAAKKFTGAMKDEEGNLTEKSDGSDSVISSTASITASSLIASPSVIEEQPKEKLSIVTLIPSEEDDMPPIVTTGNITANVSDGKTGGNTTKEESKGSSSEEIKDGSDFCKKVDNDSKRGSKSTTAFTNCELFIKMIGHSSLGCFMGSVLYSKRVYQNFTALEENSRNRGKVKVRARMPVVGKEENKTDKDSDGKGKGEDVEENDKEQGKTKRESKGQKDKPSKVEQDGTEMDHKESDSKPPKQDEANKNIASVNKNDTTRDQINPSGVFQPSEAEPSVVRPLDTQSEDMGTPALPSISSLTTKPSGTTESKSTSSVSSERTVTQRVVTKDVTDTDTTVGVNNDAKILEKQVDSSITTKVEEQQVSSSESSDQIASTIEIDTCKEQSELNAIATSQTSQAECKAPSHAPHPKDVDVLEIKILDGEGREGTAHPEKTDQDETTNVREKQVNQSSVAGEGLEKNSTIEESKASVVEINASMSGESSVVTSSTSQTSESSSTISSSKVEDPIPHGTDTPSAPLPSDAPPTQSPPSTVPPTQPPPVEVLGQPDSIPPLVAPPLSMDQVTDTAATIEASLADDATLSSVLSKAASASASQGLGTSGAQKESVLMRLTNRIKALEQNLTLSTMYMEKLNQKYRKIVEEMQKNFDKKVNLLTNATRKAEAVIRNQKEQISKLQEKLDSVDSSMDKVTKKLENLNKEVMERHIIGLFLEVILIAILFMVFRRWDRVRLRHDAVRESLGMTLDGTGPTRYRPTTKEEAMDRKPNGKLTARDRLLRSYSVPEVVGPLTQHTEEKNKELYIQQEVKKKKHRKRKSVHALENTAPNCNGSNGNHANLVNRTAGLLFSPARGLLNGISDSWRWKPVTADDSSLSSARPHMNGKILQKSKSLEVVPEESSFVHSSVPPPAQRKGRIPAPPPPPPPQFSNSWKKGTGTTNMNHKRLSGQPPPGLSAIPRRGRVGGYGNQFA